MLCYAFNIVDYRFFILVYFCFIVSPILWTYRDEKNVTKFFVKNINRNKTYVENIVLFVTPTTLDNKNN